MNKSFNDFKKTVESFCSKEHFKKNSWKLGDVKTENYKTFIKCLNIGGDINYSIRAVEEINKITIKTHLSIDEIFEVSKIFFFINSLIYVKPKLNFNPKTIKHELLEIERYVELTQRNIFYAKMKGNLKKLYIFLKENILNKGYDTFTGKNGMYIVTYVDLGSEYNDIEGGGIVVKRIKEYK